MRNSVITTKLRHPLLDNQYQKKKIPNERCKDSICNDPKLVLGSNAKGPNNKFVERGYKRTRLTSKEK